MTDYICIRPFRSRANYEKNKTGMDVACHFNNCPRPGMILNFREKWRKCSYYRALNGHPSPGADTIKHSSRITEYAMTRAKLNFHNRRGRYWCSSSGCDHAFEVGDRVVTIHAPANRKGRKQSEGTRIFCVACAEDRCII